MEDAWAWPDGYFHMSPTYPKEDRVMNAEAGGTEEVETVPRQGFQRTGSEERNWNERALHAGPTRSNRTDKAGVEFNLSI